MQTLQNVGSLDAFDRKFAVSRGERGKVVGGGVGLNSICKKKEILKRKQRRKENLGCARGHAQARRAGGFLVMGTRREPKKVGQTQGLGVVSRQGQKKGFARNLRLRLPKAKGQRKVVSLWGDSALENSRKRKACVRLIRAVSKVTSHQRECRKRRDWGKEETPYSKIQQARACPGKEKDGERKNSRTSRLGALG